MKRDTSIAFRILLLISIMFSCMPSALSQDKQIEWTYLKWRYEKVESSGRAAYKLGDGFLALPMPEKDKVAVILPEDFEKKASDLAKEEKIVIPDMVFILIAAAVEKTVVSNRDVAGELREHKFIKSIEYEGTLVYLFKNYNGVMFGASLSKDRRVVYVLPM